MRFSALLFILLSFTTICAAQINEADTSHWEYRLSGTGLYLAGNSEDIIGTGRAELAHNDAKWGVFSNTNYTYRKSGETASASDVYSRNILYYNQRARVYPYLIGNFWRSRRRGILSQYQAGPGIAFRLLGEKENYLRVGGSPVNLEITHYQSTYLEGSADSTTLLHQWRSIFFISGLRVIENGPRFVYELVWQPSLQRNLHRVYSLVGMEVPLSRYVAVRGNLEYIYENAVLAGRKRTDLLMTFGLTVSNIFKERPVEIKHIEE